MIGPDQDARYGGEMHHRVKGGGAGAGVQLGEIGIAGQHVEHRARIGDVGGQGIDTRFVQRRQIDTDDMVAPVAQVATDMAPGLAGAAGEENTHGWSPGFGIRAVFHSRAAEGMAKRKGGPQTALCGVFPEA